MVLVGIEKQAYVIIYKCKEAAVSYVDITYNPDAAQLRGISGFTVVKVPASMTLKEAIARAMLENNEYVIIEFVAEVLLASQAVKDATETTVELFRRDERLSKDIVKLQKAREELQPDIESSIIQETIKQNELLERLASIRRSEDEQFYILYKEGFNEALAVGHVEADIVPALKRKYEIIRNLDYDANSSVVERGLCDKETFSGYKSISHDTYVKHADEFLKAIYKIIS